MSYNSDFPANDEYLSVFPPGMREQLRAIIQDEIVNALKLRGYSPGNANGNIPVSNGTVCTNLNADKVDGKDSTDFALDGHTHGNATTSSDGFMSNTDKSKLDGVAAGAEVNQNAFAIVVVGNVSIQADGKQDTLTLEGGTNILITPDATNDKVTIAFTGVLPVANGGTGSSGEKYLKLTGGTVTGSITSEDAVPLKVKTTYTDNSGTTCTSNVIKANTSNSTGGNNVAFGAGGNTVIGGGESYNAQLNELAGNSDENCYVCADGTVYIKSNCNTLANAKTFAFTTGGKIQFPDGSTIWIA